MDKTILLYSVVAWMRMALIGFNRPGLDSFIRCDLAVGIRSLKEGVDVSKLLIFLSMPSLPSARDAKCDSQLLLQHHVRCLLPGRPVMTLVYFWNNKPK